MYTPTPKTETVLDIPNLQMPSPPRASLAVEKARKAWHPIYGCVYLCGVYLEPEVPKHKKNMCINKYVYIYICIIYTYIHTYIHIHMYTPIYIGYIYIYIFVFIYICIHKHLHSNTT